MRAMRSPSKTRVEGLPSIVTLVSLFMVWWSGGLVVEWSRGTAAKERRAKAARHLPRRFRYELTE